MRPTTRALTVLLALAAPAWSSDAVLGTLLDARAPAAAPAVFDGSRAGRAAPLPVRAEAPDGAAGPAALERGAPPVAPRTPAPSAPRPARGVSDGFIGLYPESDFELGTGRCEACRGTREGKWYFLDEVIATPKTGPEGVVWLGSPELVRGARLSADGRSATLEDGSVVALALADRLPSNRSVFDASSLAYLRGRTVRIRGEFVELRGVRTLVARTLWPEDFRLDPSGLAAADAGTLSGIDGLIAADKGGARGEFQTKLLWERPGAGRAWEGKPVMGFMLNGAQGDDDESLAGHFSLFTGRVGPGGSMADWMFDNFYDMDSVSEKGIVAGMVPMDKYMADLNSGQSWYRPTYMLVMVMKDARVPLEFSEAFKRRYADYYAHRIKYDRTLSPCTAQIVDPLREGGWTFPAQGPTPSLVARLVAGLAGGTDPKTREELYRMLRQEPTHLYPRAAFDSIGGDLLSLAGAYGADPLGRELSALEKRIAEDLEAVVFVRLPQIPSSRRFGRDPAGGFVDYFRRVPMDRSKWETVPTSPRPYPPPH
ncbi:MAG: hypothetical protein HY928_07770 [Elusimicrobia bacterium]|nr:hypothetical protein [Elusimicrobiota bacterium]